MDNPKHEQKQRIESQHRTEDASERVVCTRRKGDGSRSQEQDGALKPDCERGNHHGQIDGLHGAREVVVGGIMRQVSELEQRHLAYVYAHRDR
ncbi:MAG: hypothetical protein J7647_32525, partial [Cyanobacteria bacterium SBLK]|nr:hypothetical protein [Cyanobacteria bacterium SBLK]